MEASHNDDTIVWEIFDSKNMSWELATYESSYMKIYYHVNHLVIPCDYYFIEMSALPIYVFQIKETL